MQTWATCFTLIVNAVSSVPQGSVLAGRRVAAYSEQPRPRLSGESLSQRSRQCKPDRGPVRLRARPALASFADDLLACPERYYTVAGWKIHVNWYEHLVNEIEIS